MGRSRPGPATRKYRDYFYVFPDRDRCPTRTSATLPEVFPDFAPGNFTWDDELGGWVWTTFNDWQWDLNWSNPDVFCEFVDIILHLANQGVDCLRLDAIAFLWKRLGTDCQNQPEVHAITQALRAVARIAAPALVFKAEAIVGPGPARAPTSARGEHAGKVSDLAYHNTLMVQIWSALAARDARLLAAALSPVRPTSRPPPAWATYLRCHDDIGWAIDDADAAADRLERLRRTGRSCPTSTSARFPGIFAAGRSSRTNPATGDRRISGTRRQPGRARDRPRRRRPAPSTRPSTGSCCAYAIVLGFGGIPLLYMGDELGLRNDRLVLPTVPEHADDNRWMHRPEMPWDVAERRQRAGDASRRASSVGSARLVEARARPRVAARGGRDRGARGGRPGGARWWCAGTRPGTWCRSTTSRSRSGGSAGGCWTSSGWGAVGTGSAGWLARLRAMATECRRTPRGGSRRRVPGDSLASAGPAGARVDSPLAPPPRGCAGRLSSVGRATHS